MDLDEERRAKPPNYAIGQDLADLSVDDLDRLIALLRDEIGRLEADRNAKSASRSAADAVFRT